MIDPGQSNPSAKGKEGRRYFIGCFSVLIELKRLILLKKTIRVRDFISLQEYWLWQASQGKKRKFEVP